MSFETSMICRDERRRRAVRQASLNGLDYLEVSEDQRTLTIHFLGKAPESIREENVRIEGGRRVRDLRVVALRLCVQDDPEIDDCMHVTVDRPGDFSMYRLCLAEVDERGKPTGRPFPGMDPRYACLDFSFKVGCPSELDCTAGPVCPPEPRVEPEISYLAKDYASFRQLILDRLALLLPGWRERHVPDIGIALVELLAYVGDHLSYYQDAVATEAYLETARRRISVRRHVRLVDYPMHEGCNARAWVCVDTDAPELELGPGDVFFVTRFDGAPEEPGLLDPEELARVPFDRYEVFEPLVEAGRSLRFRKAHSAIPFHTWGDTECCLPKGATRATLRDEVLEERGEGYGESDSYGKRGHYGEKDLYRKPPYGQEEEHCPPPGPPAERDRPLRLAPGDVLVFEEVKGTRTGESGDADPAHRHTVLLTKVTPDVDPIGDIPVLEIEWAEEDALPFPLCLSSIGLPDDDCPLLEGVSVACGNVVLVDHGRTVSEELGVVEVERTEECCQGEGRPSEVAEIPARFRPVLRQAPLVFREPLDPGAPASRRLRQDPRRALPQIELAAEPAPEKGGAWQPRRDLLDSGPSDLHVAVETDDEGRAHLRFGDGELGRRPAAGTSYRTTYRIGHGPAGNVGPQAISLAVVRQTLSGVRLSPRNPLPAQGGTAPEPLAEVKLLAPHVFREELQRAITADDYARIVEREFRGRVQRAVATLRWTGSGTEVLVAVDPVGGQDDEGLLREIEAALRRYRRIGHDVVVRRAEHVPLLLEMRVCVLPSALRSPVQTAIRNVLGTRTLPDGRRGFFHADELTFGQGIALSKLIAAVQAVPGVESLEVTRFERLHEGPAGEIEDGFLALGPREIARMDNDLRFPDNGRLQLDLRGGR